MSKAQPHRIMAMVSSQGTACAETALVGKEFTADARRALEAQFCTGEADAPVAGSWTDCTQNEALAA